MIDGLVSRAAVVLGRVDKWEMDTLNCVRTMAKLDYPVRFSRKLRGIAEAYLKSNSPWVQLTTWKSIETPDWIWEHVKEWPGAHGDLPGRAEYRFTVGDKEYRCVCEYGDYDSAGELRTVWCNIRTILSGYEAAAVSSSSDVVSICHCPHWTPPDKIAALLVSPRLVGSKSAAVAIYNDELCTHAALSCQ
jgi:hypothetical protein